MANGSLSSHSLTVVHFWLFLAFSAFVTEFLPEMPILQGVTTLFVFVYNMQ